MLTLRVTQKKSFSTRSSLAPSAGGVLVRGFYPRGCGVLPQKSVVEASTSRRAIFVTNPLQGGTPCNQRLRQHQPIYY